MSDAHRTTYLNDHLAGAVAALELMEHLEKAYGEDDPSMARFFAELRADVEADRRTLESLMDRLHVDRSATRQTTAWLAERAVRLKLRLDDPSGGPLRLLEALETLGTGIHGKVALWCALAAAAERDPALRGTDYDALARRAEEQRARLEAVRLGAARAALAGDSA
ncbi:MAG TPA: hypothetical protein VFS44_01670 [Gemmatimonadaceae bacterium]|nr:hypothetical protein [Gemmatimonadaceae bacterium]